MNRGGFYFLVGTFGALALVSQVIFLRQLMVAFYGNEMVIAVVLAGWLSGVFAGARFMGLWRLEGRRLHIRLLIIPILWMLLLAVLLTLSYYLEWLAGLSAGEVAPLEKILFWALLLTAPASFFVGGLFVLAGVVMNQAWPASGDERRKVGAGIFWIESAGSGLGLLFYTFCLAGRVGAWQVTAFFSGLVLLALILTFVTGTRRRLTGVGLILSVGLGLYSSDAVADLDRACDRKRFLLTHPAYRLKAVKETPYQHLALAERGGEQVLYGNNIFWASWPDPYQYQVLTLFFLTEAAACDRILLAGQGPGGFIHEFLAHPVKELVYLALDPAETALTSRYLTPEHRRDLQDPRLIIVHDDLRRFLKQTGKDFDLIVVNAPDPDNAQINRLYTLEFFSSAAKRLRENGVFITSITGADNFWSRELWSYGLSLYKTMDRVFSEVLVTPGDRHFFLAARKKGLLTSDQEELARRYRARDFRSPYLTPESLIQFFPPTGLEYINSRLSEPGPVQLNTDVMPLSYYLRLIWWEKMTGREWTRAFLSRAMEVEKWAPVSAAVLGLFFLYLIFRPSPTRISRWTMSFTGAVMMALQILLIFMFQNTYGVIYQKIGLLSALFMAGLAGGGLLGRRFISIWPRPGPIIFILELLLAGLCALAGAAASKQASFLILPLVAGSGLVCGFEFAFLFALYLEDPDRPSVRKALAGLEAADHSGAVVGALITGLVLAPVIGLEKTALALAILKLVNGLTILRLRS